MRCRKLAAKPRLAAANIPNHAQTLTLHPSTSVVPSLPVSFDMDTNQEPPYHFGWLEQVLYFALTALIAKLIFTLIWRVWFHPLASVPGPRFAAVSSLWEAWQDIGLDGRFPRTVLEPHRKHSLSCPMVHYYNKLLSLQAVISFVSLQTMSTSMTRISIAS